MAAALRLLVDGPQLAFVAAFAIVTVLLEVFMRYSRYASVLRWLTISLFAYVATVLAVGVPWLRSVAPKLATTKFAYKIKCAPACSIRMC
jgi:biotin transporter BioY